MKPILAIFCFILFRINSYGQEYATFCNIQYGGELLKASGNVTDSLRNIGVDSIITYNHYSQGFGYSKIFWTKNNAVCQIQIIERRTENKRLIRTTDLNLHLSNKTLNLFNLKTLEAESSRIKDCSGFMSHQPYHLLYLYINGQEGCISIAESQLKCNTSNGKVKLIKELTMRPEEYYKLAVIKDEDNK